MKQMTSTKLAQTLARDCIAFRVRVLNRVITNLYDAVLKPFGITVNQTTILATLTLAGEVSPGAIGHELVMEKSTVSRNLERMRKNGWVETVAQGIRVTAAGRALFTSLHPAWEKAQEDAEGLRATTESGRSKACINPCARHAACNWQAPAPLAAVR